MIALQPPPPPQAAVIANVACAEAVLDVLATRRIDVPWWVEIHCPGDDRFPAGYRGYAWITYDHPRSAWVAIHSTVVANPLRLRHVVAHELCHIAYALASRDLSEATADACATNLGWGPT